MALAALLDQARTHSNLPSDYALSKRLSVTTQTVSNWRHERKYPGLLEIFSLADLAGRPRDVVIAELELDRAVRAGRSLQEVAWKEKLTKMSSAVFGVFATAILSGLISASPDASAMAFSQGKAANASSSVAISPVTHCRAIKLSLETPAPQGCDAMRAAAVANPRSKIDSATRVAVVNSVSRRCRSV